MSEPKGFASAFLGTMAAGLTPSPIASPVTFQGNDSYVEHVAEIVRAARPALILADATLLDIAEKTAELVGGVRAIALEDRFNLPLDGSARHSPAELQLLQFTSGSSGTPKGVKVTRENLAANVDSIHRWLQVGAADSCSSWLPLYHDMGLIGTFLGSVTAQIDFWLMSPLDFLRSPLRWLEVHGRQGVSITSSPNFGYAYTAKRVKPEDVQDMDFSAWRIALSGAERIDPRVTTAFAELLAPSGFRATAFTPCYGMAEATLAVTGVAPAVPARTVHLEGGLRPGEMVTATDAGPLGSTDPSDRRESLTSCGRPLPDVVVDIVGEDAEVLPAGHFGEIRVTGTGVADGYVSTAASSSSTFTTAGLRTGDAGFILDGELFVIGRVGDSLKIRGRKVHAEDLETRLTAIDGIHGGRCAIALGSSGQSQHVVAVIESAGTGWLTALLSSIRAATDESVEVTVTLATRGAIPRTSSGKPRRRLIWRRFLDDDLPGEIVHGERPAQTVAGS